MKKYLDTLPSSPGVYIMKDHRGTILYIGKAKLLKQRVKQYFIPGRDGREMVPYLTAKVADIETIIVPDEKEALLLECTLIKKHKPPYNILLKDDKTFISIRITTHKKWPEIAIVRNKGYTTPDKHTFGPYTSAYAARQTVQLMQKLFPLRQCSDAELTSRKRPCILYGIKRCIAPCVGLCTKEEYDAHVEHAIAFLKGDNDSVIKALEQEREEAAKQLEFERAGALHTTISQIRATIASQKALVHSAKKDCDVFGIYRLGDAFSIMKLIFRQGRMTGAEPYYFRNIASSEEEMWESFLLQHYQLQKSLPKEIILPTPLPNESFFEEYFATTVTIPKIGTKTKLLDMAHTNAAAAFQEATKERVLLTLQDLLSLHNIPTYIECVDTSNIAGSDQVGSVIAYIDGQYASSHTRHYTIKSIDKGDDYGAMRETLRRHLKRKKEKGDLPDLLIVDGGKGQRNIALDVLSELEIASVEVVAIAKEEALHTKGMTKEKAYVSHKKDPIALPEHSAELHLLQAIRDEAHRVAIAFHKKKRQKRMISSVLSEIPGIGPKKRTDLLAKFGSVKNIMNASDEELLSIPSIQSKDIEMLRKHLHS